MNKKRFVFATNEKWFLFDNEDEEYMDMEDCKDKLNEQQATISQLEEEKDYWKSKAMTLLMQVRRLTPRMSDKEIQEFSKELEDE